MSQHERRHVSPSSHCTEKSWSRWPVRPWLRHCCCARGRGASALQHARVRGKSYQPHHPAQPERLPDPDCRHLRQRWQGKCLRLSSRDGAVWTGARDDQAHRPGLEPACLQRGCRSLCEGGPLFLKVAVAIPAAFDSSSFCGRLVDPSGRRVQQAAGSVAGVSGSALLPRQAACSIHHLTTIGRYCHGCRGAIGLLSGLTGMGGGILLTPLLCSTGAGQRYAQRRPCQLCSPSSIR